MTHAPRRRPSLEVLEDRRLPASAGLTWPDPGHLTLSLMPDGTTVGGVPSTLDQTLTGQFGGTGWRLEVVRAFQSWAALTNINIALVPDDARGPEAIRVGAVPLSDGTLAMATPYSPGDPWSGTVLLNSRGTFAPSSGPAQDFYSALLHEAGHVLGLDHNPGDRASAMYPFDVPHPGGPDPADAAAIRALYGSRPAGAGPHATTGSAVAIDFDAAGGKSAFTAVDAALDGLGSADVYKFTDPQAGPFTVDLMASGSSLLAARVTVLDASGRAVASASAADALHNDLTVGVPNGVARARYYVRVESARGDAFGVGAYRLSVGEAGPARIALSAPAAAAAGGNHDPNHVTDLTPQTPGTDARWAYLADGALGGDGSQACYRITAGSAAGALVVTAWGSRPGGPSPRLTVLDARRNALPFRVLSQDGGGMTVQVLSPAAGARYVIKVWGDPQGARSGGFTLAATFLAAPLSTPVVASGTLSGAKKTLLTLTLTEPVVYHFDLSGAADGSAAARTAVSLTVFDATRKPVFYVHAIGGAAAPGSGDVFLPAGTYTIRVLAATDTGDPLPAFRYTVLGEVRSHAVGPAPSDPTLTPIGSNSPLPGIDLAQAPDPAADTWLLCPFNFDDFLVFLDPFGLGF